MKRGAERQLIREDGDDDIQEVEGEPGQGMQKADETILAGRKMRGLPKRSIGAAPTTSSSAASDTKPKFGGFSGFGATTTNPTPFSFGATPSTSSIPSAAPVTTPASSFFSVPPVASNASNATKTFASFLSPPAPTPTPPEPKSTPPSSVEDEITVETKYLTALRGLNVSFLSAVSKAVESDPFLDVAGLLERYKSLRITVKAEYDDSLKKLKSSKSSTLPSVPTPPSGGFVFGGSTIKPTNSTDAKSTSAPDTQSPFSMPKPPSGGFSGFPTFGSSSTTSSSGGASGSAPPKTEAPSDRVPSFFNFGSSTTNPPDNKPPPAPTKSAFSFEKPASSTTAAAPSPFSFGNTSSGSKPGGTTSSVIFGPSSSSAPSVFSSNLFGKPEASKDDEAKPSSSSSSGPSFFSNVTPSPFGTSNNATSTSTTSSTPAGFSFGSSSGPSASTGTGTGTIFGSGNGGGKPSIFGGFGGKSGVGNPVGFNFGTHSKTDDAESTSFLIFSKPSAFSFGAPPASSSTPPTLPVPDSDKDKDGESSVATSLEGTPAAEDQPSSSHLTSIHDAEGEGEEDEETAHEVRSKVYKMTKKSDGSQEWIDMGVGFLRVKKHKETGSRRVLLRNSSTGKIIINFNIYTGMNPVASKNVVSFVGHDHSDLAVTRGSATPFKLRVKTELQARELKEALEKAIEALPNKSD